MTGDFIEVNALSEDGTEKARMLLPCDGIAMVGEVNESNLEAYRALGIKGDYRAIITLKYEGLQIPFAVSETYDEIAEQLL